MTTLFYMIGIGAFLISLEFIAGKLMGRNVYNLKDTLANLTISLGEASTVFIWGSSIYFLHTILYDLTPLRLEAGVWVYLLCFVVTDFMFYVFHVIAHKVRWMWASHMVHHSSEEFNLTVAIRQPWTAQISLTFLSSTPLAMLGIEPSVMFTVNFLTTVSQYLLHTRLVPKLGPLEWVFVTPSHHRVHHGSNPRYVDTNYGGNLIIWDKLFGTFQEELDEEPVQYGIIEQVDTYNPIRLAFFEWTAMARDLARLKDWRNLPRVLFGQPGWKEEGPGKTAAEVKTAWREEQAQAGAAAQAAE